MNRYREYFLGDVSIIDVISTRASEYFFMRSLHRAMLKICSFTFNEHRPTSERSVWLLMSESESLFSFSCFEIRFA